MIRKFLDRLYLVSGAISAGFLVLICALVTVQVLLNLTTKLFGVKVAMTIPSYAEFAGFFLAAASFLALAYTLTRGGHIRVTLMVQFLPKKAHLIAEVFALGLGAITAAYTTWYMALLTMESIKFGDLSPGIIAVPLWIPQVSLTVGLAIFAIALVDLSVRTIIGQKIVLQPQDWAE
ncbi:TRAP dicarboxylate transporter, DctQ subunit, unknown substrate 5 [hydrothermal vent metagenome]|uniref:Tripartite ATP-independent periplasmic transporters DctQ component domain-containing protein n=1 Tax=hydrothermal vent metagenome TaxID=652676 RepID=A0A3B0TY75_9ZZZZ